MNCSSAHCVGDYFLLQTDQNSGDAITNLKLQKLCYYAQAWHVTLMDRPLFSERIKAWAHGPVVPDLYHRFKKYRWDAIDPSDVRTDPYEDMHSDDLQFLAQIWAQYGPMSGKQLEYLTHSEEPWKLAYGDRPMGSACENEITLEAMKAYYGRQLAAA